MGETSGKTRPFHAKVHKEADGIVNYFIWGYLFIGWALSPVHSTYIPVLIMSLINMALYYSSKAFGKGKFWPRVVVGILLWNFNVQFILQLHGAFEMHFFYFITITALLFYESKKVIIPMVVYAIVSFVLLFNFSSNGMYVVLDQIENLTTRNVILHLLLVSVYGVLACFWANAQRRQTEQSALDHLKMDEQLKLMENNIDFARNISQGNLEAEYKAFDDDKLGNALIDMRQSLLDASEREAKERFINIGLASIGEILRNNADNLDNLCDQVIGKLVGYMKANQGGIFIVTEDSDKNIYLDLKACRAYDRKKFIQKRLQLGQGLVGQAAIEKRTIYMTEIPDGYINITSGLGLANPNSLLIVPLKSNERIMGVLEMASFEIFNETDLEFLEKVGESIAATIINANTNQQTQVLLEQSKQMTEEMQAQEEEMRQNMEEMQATQEEMARGQKELAQKETNLNALINNTSDSIITIDRNYNILVMNNVVKQRYKGTQYEGMAEGSNALDMLGDVRDEWKAKYDKAMNGEALNFTLKSSVHRENTWREYFINPIKDKNSSIVGVSVFSRDITRRKQLEVEMDQREYVLNGMINNTSDTYFAIDTDYKIMVVNDVLRNRFKESSVDLKPGMNILDLLPSEIYGKWKDRYDRCLDGEKISLEEERPVKDKILYTELRCEPIIDNDSKIIGASVTSKDITELKEMREKVAELTNDINGS
ncbi:MAG: PAS domain-containing protein [Bacteroidota bacterium]